MRVEARERSQKGEDEELTRKSGMNEEQKEKDEGGGANNVSGM